MNSSVYFKLFVSWKGYLTLLKYDGSFNDMCVLCGEVTMQISSALLVLELFSLYLVQMYKSVFCFWYTCFLPDVSYVLLTG